MHSYLAAWFLLLEKHITGIGTVDGDVAHGARLVFRGLVMRRPLRSLHRETMALQAHQVDLAHAQKARIG